MLIEELKKTPKFFLIELLVRQAKTAYDEDKVLAQLENVRDEWVKENFEDVKELLIERIDREKQEMLNHKLVSEITREKIKSFEQKVNDLEDFLTGNDLKVAVDVWLEKKARK